MPTNTTYQSLTLNLYSSVYRRYLSVTHIEPVLQCVDATCQSLTLNLYSSVYRRYLSVTHIEPVTGVHYPIPLPTEMLLEACTEPLVTMYDDDEVERMLAEQ